MSSQVTNYQCPACTAPLHFSASTGKLVCDFCGSSYDVKEIEALYAKKDAAAAQSFAAAEARGPAPERVYAAAPGETWDPASMRAYSCPSCGAQILCDATTAATSCPYCGNPSIVPGNLTGLLKPRYILPFRLEKEAAVAALKKHCKGKLLLPKAFTRHNHIEELQGVYVPFWLFDGDAEGRITYKASSSTSYRDGDYEVTETRHYDVLRSGSMAFEKVPVDGSSKMPDDYMDSIEPYDYSELTDFSTAYLPGYLAEKYDVDAAAAEETANGRCAGTVEDKLSETVVGYDSVQIEDEEIQVQQDRAQYALLPVWMLTTRWKDRNYLFAMNGQTGKMVGDLPADKGRLRAWFWGTFFSASVILSLLFSGPLGRAIANMLF